MRILLMTYSEMMLKIDSDKASPSRWLSSELLHRAVWYTFNIVSDVLPAYTIKAMRWRKSTSGTSVNFYQTARGNVQEDSHLHIRRGENLKTHSAFLLVSSGWNYISVELRG
jgi:hypothetical protein